jgi:hypothetical protein
MGEKADISPRCGSSRRLLPAFSSLNLLFQLRKLKQQIRARRDNIGNEVSPQIEHTGRGGWLAAPRHSG